MLLNTKIDFHAERLLFYKWSGLHSAAYVMSFDNCELTSPRCCYECYHTRTFIIATCECNNCLR